jgi:heme/copper-type cytochrome/quinol oxidase subunit 4
VSGMLNGLLALVSLVITAVCFYMYTRSNPPQTLYIILAIIFVILMVVFGAMFLSGRVNKSDDIHITE